MCRWVRTCFPHPTFRFLGLGDVGEEDTRWRSESYPNL